MSQALIEDSTVTLYVKNSHVNSIKSFKNTYDQSHSFSKWARSCEKCLMLYANNKGADQPAHPHSLISTFVFAA